MQIQKNKENECEEKVTDYKGETLEREKKKKDKKTDRKRGVGGLADVLASSGEVHGVLGIIVDLNCLGQCLGVPAITLTGHVTAFSAARQRKAGFIGNYSHHRNAGNGGCRDKNRNQDLCSGASEV